MLENLSKKDTKKAFELLNKMQKQGIEARFFMEKLMEDLHSRMLGKLGVSEQESEFSLLEIKKMLEMLSKSYMDAKYALLPHMPLEFFIIEWTNNDNALKSPSEFDESLNASSPHSISPSQSRYSSDGG